MGSDNITSFLLILYFIECFFIQRCPEVENIGGTVSNIDQKNKISEDWGVPTARDTPVFINIDMSDAHFYKRKNISHNFSH